MLESDSATNNIHPNQNRHQKVVNRGAFRLCGETLRSCSGA